MNETLIMAFTGVVACSTLVYVVITAWLAIETRKMRQIQSEPRVSVQAEVDQDGHPGYELVIRNVGQGPAKDVRFDFRGDPSYFRKSFVGYAPPQVNQLPAIRDGLDYMEVGYTLRFTLGTVTEEEFRRAAQEPWTIDVRYKNLIGKPIRSTCVVDFSQFHGSLFRRNWIKEASKSLDSMSKEMSRWGTGFHKIHAIVHQEKSQNLSDLVPEEEELASQMGRTGIPVEFVENHADLGTDSGSESE